jgi:hypothetical protein
MAIRTISAQPLNALNMRLVTSSYDSAGDFNDATFVMPVSEANYFLRTVLLSGALRMSFPETTEPDAFTSENGGIGAIFPGQQLYGKTKVRATALEDNTTFCCVQPLPNYKIVSDTRELNAGELLSVPVGRVLFVFGSEYVVNGEAHMADDIFALVNSAGEIQAGQPCKVVTFTSVIRD